MISADTQDEGVSGLCAPIDLTVGVEPWREGETMDRSNIVAQLASLTGGLVPAPGATADELRTVREALVRQLLAGRAEVDAMTGGLPAAPAAAPSTDLLHELERLVGHAEAASPAGGIPLVFRRSLPATVVAHPELAPSAMTGMRARAFGPFVDALGAPHWFDIVPPLQQTTITRSGDPAPFLSLPLTVPAGAVPTSLAIGPGSLWMAAPLLAAGAPAGSYAGLLIKGGTLAFSAAAVATGSALQTTAGTTVTLTVQPDAPKGPTGQTGPGADGGAVVADVPPSVRFVFGPMGATVTAVQAASLVVYGTTVNLSWKGAGPVFNQKVSQLLIPLEPQTGTFSVKAAQSTLFAPAGSAPIVDAAWGLPVAVTSAAQLGMASSAGLLVLRLGPGLTATWNGMAAGPSGLQAAVLEAVGGMLALIAVPGVTGRLGTTVKLWPSASAGSTFSSEMDVEVPRGGSVYYTSIGNFAGTTQTELIAAAAQISAHIDRPLAADGSRIGPDLPGWIVWYQNATRRGVLIVGERPATPVPPPIALALRNALCVTTPPGFLLVTGTFGTKPTELNSGGLLLVFGLQTILPTLPDPYAANFLPQIRDRGHSPVSSLLLASVVWSPTVPTALNFADVALGAASFPATALDSTGTPAAATRSAMLDARAVTALEASFNQSLATTSPNLYLLDVSTNIDQFGVALATYDYPWNDAVRSTGSRVAVAGLDLVAPTETLRVFTTPAVQWEPVVTVQNPKVLPSPFPSPAGFRDDGGPTLLGANDVTLVPVAPAPLLDEVVAAYRRGAAAAVRFTLPFGMKATAVLPARPKHYPSWIGHAGLTPVRPDFTSQAMVGGRQIALTAPVNLITPSESTPSIPGSAVQLRNLVDQAGSPLVDPRPQPVGGQQLSVLGPAVDTIFNSEFAPSGTSPRIPVTRIDFSGYGASTFSSWVDTVSPPPTVVQVRFNVIVGRTNHEVVQIKSRLYPCKSVVVRTITIDRQDDTEISRYDSGWQSVTSGTFLPDDDGISVHPGAVKGAFNIREIRDTAQSYAGTGGVELVGVYFDADIQIDGVISGARNGLVPSIGQFGWVQTTPANTPLTATQLAEVISANGPPGGPVDCVLAVGGTAQTMRVTRVEVDNAPHPGAPETHEFAAVARGSVVLPQPGSWSVVCRTDMIGEPTPVDPDRGVALLRQGPAGGPAPATPWRLAEAVDLWTPAAPSMDFCLLHTTDSSRVLFPRPQIAAGASAFTSDQIPLLADGFALMGATSICPRQDTCLLFPNANYALHVDGAGAFTLVNVPPVFMPSLPGRTLSTGSAGTIGFEYADEHGTTSQVSMAITPNDWSIGLHGVNVRLDLGPFNGLMRTAGDFQATRSGGVSMQNGRLVLGSVLQPLETMFEFLEKLGLPDPLSMSFSNAGSKSSTSYKLKAGLAFSLPSPLLPALTPLLQTPEWKIGIALKASFGNSASSAGALFTSTSRWSFNFSLSGNMQWAIFPLVYAGGLIGFGLSATFPAGIEPQSESLSFQLGVIASIGGDIVPKVVKIQGSVSFSFMLIIGIAPSTSVTLGCGIGLSVSGSILDGLVAISFGANANGLVTVTSPRSVQANFDVSIDVTICWCLDIGFDMSWQYTQSI